MTLRRWFRLRSPPSEASPPAVDGEEIPRYPPFLRGLPTAPVIADALRDRLQHTALTLTITGESYRGVKARKLAGSRQDQ